MSGAPATSRLFTLVLFALAMGWLEAVVVVYIRGLLGLPHGGPLPVDGDLVARLRAIPWLTPTEQTRETATLIMLAAVGWLAGTGATSRFGAFLVAFGVWDIAYYLGLFALLAWPPSLFTRDLLFLIPPHPWWNQPVWLPVSIAIVMIALGVRLMFGSARR